MIRTIHGDPHSLNQEGQMQLTVTGWLMFCLILMCYFVITFMPGPEGYISQLHLINIENNLSNATPAQTFVKCYRLQKKVKKPQQMCCMEYLNLTFSLSNASFRFVTVN